MAGVELFDPSSGQFRTAAAMVTPRHSHTATVLADGKVLIAGGYDARGAYLRSVELYDPATGRFGEVAPMTLARAGHEAVRLVDGRVLLVGGVSTGWTFVASAEIFDPESGTFATTGAMQVPRASHSAVLLIDGRVLVVGGHRGRRQDIELFTSAEVYDPRSGAFTPTGPMAVRRHSTMRSACRMAVCWSVVGRMSATLRADAPVPSCMIPGRAPFGGCGDCGCHGTSTRARPSCLPTGGSCWRAGRTPPSSSIRPPNGHAGGWQQRSRRPVLGRRPARRWAGTSSPAGRGDAWIAPGRRGCTCRTSIGGVRRSRLSSVDATPPDRGTLAAERHLVHRMRSLTGALHRYADLLQLDPRCGTSAVRVDGPNVLYIVIDDLGWIDTGAYGSTFHETPHIDRLLQEGARFSQFYTASGVCSPTRASLMTGRTPARVGITDWIGGEQAASCCPPCMSVSFPSKKSRSGRRSRRRDTPRAISGSGTSV